MIEFTQYLRPDGRERKVTIDRPAEIERLAYQIVHKLGGTFTVEELMTGEAAVACETPEDGDIALEVVPNGPQVPDAVDRMVRAAWKYLELLGRVPFKD